MLMFCPGDLVRIPSNVELIKKPKSELNLIEKVTYTRKPTLAIFIEYTSSGDCIVNTDGTNWHCSMQSIRIAEVTNDKISSNYERVEQQL